MKSQAEERRLFFIDLLKSIAIFMVLSYHGTNYNFDFLQENRNALFYLRYYCRTILSCGTPLFFFVNGFLLLNRSFSLKKHIRKMIRLILLTVFWSVVDLFLLMYIRKEFLSVQDFIIGVWTGKHGWIHHFWFLKALFVIYILFPLLKAVFDNRRDLFYFFTVVAAILTFGNVFLNVGAYISAQLFFGKDPGGPYNWFNGFNLFQGIYGYTFVYFCVGGIAADLKNKIKFTDKTRVSIGIIVLSTLGLFAMGTVLSGMSRESWDVVWNGYDTVFTFVNVFCIYCLSTKYKGNHRLPRKVFFLISTNTFGIYAIHVLFVQLFNPRIQGSAILSNIPGNILYTLVILFVSLVTVLLIRKIPLLKKVLL